MDLVSCPDEKSLVCVHRPTLERSDDTNVESEIRKKAWFDLSSTGRGYSPDTNSGHLSLSAKQLYLNHEANEKDSWFQLDEPNAWEFDSANPSLPRELGKRLTKNSNTKYSSSFSRMTSFSLTTHG